VALVVLVAAVATGIYLIARPSRPAAKGSAAGPPAATSTGPTAFPASTPSSTSSAASATPATTPATSRPSRTIQLPPSPVDIVAEYYAAVNSHNWRGAWNLGGKNFGQPYAKFVAGYAGTVRAIVTVVNVIDVAPHKSTVAVHLLAVNDNNTTVLYNGTYTVTSAVITSAALAAVTSQPTTTFERESPAAQLPLFGYQPNSTARAGAGFRAVLATCIGSGDGHCQKAFFYVGSGLVAVDTPQADIGVTLAWERGNTVALRYPQYRPRDPMCCPGGGTLTIHFHWNGSTVTASPALPQRVNGR
jgi:hypothetical protein